MDDGEAAERIVPQILKCLERRARYLGLDAPERAEVTTTVLPAADSAVQALLARAGTSWRREGDRLAARA